MHLAHQINFNTIKINVMSLILLIYKICLKHRLNFLWGRVFLHVIPEHFTSQLCSRCGSKNNVGGSKQYDCGNCGLKIDRDVNSCRSLYMSWLN